MLTSMKLCKNMGGIELINLAACVWGWGIGGGGTLSFQINQTETLVKLFGKEWGRGILMFIMNTFLNTFELLSREKLNCTILSQVCKY